MTPETFMTPEADELQQVTFRVSAEELAAFDRLAEAECRTRAGMLRWLMQREVAVREQAERKFYPER